MWVSVCLCVCVSGCVSVFHRYMYSYMLHHSGHKPIKPISNPCYGGMYIKWCVPRNTCWRYFSEHSHFYRALLQKRPIILRGLLALASACDVLDVYTCDTQTHWVHWQANQKNRVRSKDVHESPKYSGTQIILEIPTQIDWNLKIQNTPFWGNMFPFRACPRVEWRGLIAFARRNCACLSLSRKQINLGQFVISPKYSGTQIILEIPTQIDWNLKIQNTPFWGNMFPPPF